MGKGSRGRHTRSVNLGRRCSELGCKKLSKDLIDGKYLCRIHSPKRYGFKLDEEDTNG